MYTSLFGSLLRGNKLRNCEVRAVIILLTIIWVSRGGTGIQLASASFVEWCLSTAERVSGAASCHTIIILMYFYGLMIAYNVVTAVRFCSSLFCDVFTCRVSS